MIISNLLIFFPFFIGTKPIVIVSDIRRKSDIAFFRDNGYHIKTIRINADTEVRQSRGWKFECGVDDVQSECDLDDYNKWDMVIDNDNTANTNEIIRKIVSLIL